MAKKKFTDIARMAIWVGYHKKCQYCRAPINYNDLHIDHIIAEEHARDDQRYRALLAELGLPLDFNINSYLNLFPSHAACNLQKSNTQFDRASLHFYLNIARTRTPSILEEAERIRSRRYTEKLLIDVTLALGVGAITDSQVSDVLQKGGFEGGFKKIGYKPKFVDFELDGYLSSKSVDRLLDEKIGLGGGYVSSFQMINDDGNTCVVQTCREVKSAIENNFYPITTFDIKMYAFCIPVLGIVKALSLASVSSETFVNDVGVTDIDLLPVNIFPAISPDQRCELDEAALTGVTIADWVRGEKIKIISLSRCSIQLEFGGFGVHFRELLRADLNQNGCDEILLFEYVYATEGTYGCGGLRLLSRNGKEEIFQHCTYDEF